MGAAASSLNLTPNTMQEIEARLTEDNKAELLQAVSRMGGMGGMGPAADEAALAAEREALAAEAEAVIATLDSDGDGSISMEELRAHMRQRGATDTSRPSSRNPSTTGRAASMSPLHASELPAVCTAVAISRAACTLIPGARASAGGSA